MIMDKINSNIGCIETFIFPDYPFTDTSINSNIGCIETTKLILSYIGHT